MQTNNITKFIHHLRWKIGFSIPTSRGPSCLLRQKWNLAINCQKKKASVDYPSNSSKGKLQPMFQQNLNWGHARILFKLKIPINVLLIFHKNILFLIISSMTIPTKTKPIYNNHNNGHNLQAKILRTNLEWHKIIFWLNSMLCSQNSNVFQQFYKGLSSKDLGLEIAQNPVLWYENCFATQ